MREIFTSGSVGGASGNRCFYLEDGLGKAVPLLKGSICLVVIAFIIGFRLSLPSHSALRYAFEIKMSIKIGVIKNA